MRINSFHRQSAGGFLRLEFGAFRLRRASITTAVLLLFAALTSSQHAFAQCAPTSPTTENFADGPGASAPAYRSTAIGSNASTLCENSVAIGANASTSGFPGGGTAIGSQSSAIGLNSTALGIGAKADGAGAVSLGSGKALANGAIAVGANSNASFASSVAIGPSAATTASNQFMFGTSSSTYTMPGITSAASTTSQTGQILYITTDSAGNLAAVSAVPGSTPVVNDLTTGGATSALSAQQGVALNGLVGTAQSTANNAQNTANSAQATANGALQRTGGTMTGDINMGGNRITNVGAPVDGSDAVTKDYADAQYMSLGTGLANVRSEINSLSEKVDENTQGIAIAMAMSGLTVPEGKTFAVSTNLGFYDDKQAIATQAALRINDVVVLNGGVGMGLNSSSKVGGRVGLSAAW